jgi:hypothetical protein
MKSLTKETGGYFELELPEKDGHLYPEALKFQSARAAFYALLEAGKPKCIWMPKYICDSMLSPIYSLNINLSFYDLTEQLGVSDQVILSETDWLLYVNYFGICDEQEVSLLKRFNSNQLIFDHSQAFYSPPLNCLATLYSPRKFFGVPDGGYLVSKISVNEPLTVDTLSVSRCSHLLQRLDGDIALGYKSFKQTEKSFQDVLPRKMSTLTNRLLAGIDYETIKNKRNTNFKFLHKHLARVNNLKIAEQSFTSPLCYPLLLDKTKVRSRLLENKIFVATYWVEVKNKVDVESLEYKLTEKCIPIPCDQRYETDNLKLILNSIDEINNV